MKKKFLLIFLGISALIFPPGYFVVKKAFAYISDYLSKSEKVSANILIVEGWLPDNALDIAAEEFQSKQYEYVITTGLKSISEYYLLSTNGNLVFYTRNRFKSIAQSGTHSIEIEAYSDMGGENRAHFNLFINNSKTGDFFVEKRRKAYTSHWNGNLNDVDSIAVQYDNDKMDYFGDRNLFVKQICIDNQITVPFLNNSRYVLDYQIRRSVLNNYTSNAELTRNKLMTLGIDSTRIITTAGKKAKINRTLTSALAFRDWIKTTTIDVKGINIISLGTHARRTWMTYNKILDEKYKIGIISVPEPIIRHSRENKLFKTVRETLGIIYYWIILIPY